MMGGCGTGAATPTPKAWTQECLVCLGGVHERPATLGDSDGPLDSGLSPLVGQRLVLEGTPPGRRGGHCPPPPPNT